MSEGHVSQVIGPVVDVDFPPGQLPALMSALKLTNPSINGNKDNLTLEVAQHLGESSVRTIANIQPNTWKWACDPANNAPVPADW